MGMCHTQRNANRGPGEDSCDTASTDRDCKHHPGAVAATDNVKQSITEAVTSTSLKQSNIDLADSGKHRAAEGSVA
jgi:hypothetical protein